MSTATRVISALPTGTAYSRYLMCLGASRGDSMRARMAAESLTDSPQVLATLELRTKALIAPATTTDATFAAPLAAFGIAAEALALERGKSIIGQLEPKFRRVPFHVKIPRETGTGTGGAWVAEGGSVPVARTAYDTLTQDAYKASIICVLTRELLQIGNPSAERTVRETTAAGVAAFLDSQFLTSTITAIANTRPAAVTNGATSVASTGTTAAAINADLAALLAAITTNGSGLTWVMRPMTAYKIAATIGGTAAVDIPRSLFGIPMVLSINSPQQVTLLDANDILYSDDGAIDISTTDEATIQMDTLPTDPAVAATVFQSLWGNNLWAIRVNRWLAYQRAQAGAVSFMTVTY